MISRFKTLNRGALRILWILSLLAPVFPFLVSIMSIMESWPSMAPHGNEDYLFAVFVPLACLVGPFLAVWIVARLVIWIVDGFMESKTKEG